MGEGLAVALCVLSAAAVIAVVLWRVLRIGNMPPHPIPEGSPEQRALVPEPTAPDIFAGRLVSLLIASRAVFPWVRDPKAGVSYPPVSAIWQGTAAQLRETLLSRGSRLSFGQRREIPGPDALEHRLRTMARGNGRVRVELIGLGDRQIWRLTLNH